MSPPNCTLGRCTNLPPFMRTGAGNMARAAEYPVKPLMPVAGDDAAKKAVVMELVGALGFEPVDEATLESPWLVAPNRALAAYAAWHRWIDVWVVLRARDPEYVLTWRVEAEEKMKASGKPGLSRADIEDYIRRFLPAYRTWGGAPRATPDDRCLEFTINLDRSVNRSR